MIRRLISRIRPDGAAATAGAAPVAAPVTAALPASAVREEHEALLRDALRAALGKGLRPTLAVPTLDVLDQAGGGAPKVADKATSGRVLFLGPSSFKSEIWKTRCQYILPEIFGALPEGTEIHWVTGRLPKEAQPPLRRLCRSFNIRHRDFGRTPAGMTQKDYQLAAAVRIAREIEPQVVSNLFGGVLFGHYAAIVGAATGARAVVRVPGDEIGARLHMGTYDTPASGADLAEDTWRQATGYALADAVIVMTPAERERAGTVVADLDKVKVCVRGVDLERFQGRERPPEAPVRRIVFVGRNSLEKGSDILMEVADLLARRRPEVEIVVAGDFPSGERGTLRFLGFVAPEGLPGVYRDADIFLSCSRTEGFPQALGEALAMGVTAVAPRHIFEGTFGEDKGVVLADNTPQAIVDTLVALIDDPARVAGLSRAALAYARRSLDAGLWRNLYTDIMFGRDSNHVSL